MGKTTDAIIKSLVDAGFYPSRHVDEIIEKHVSPLEQRLAEAEAVIAKLPRTADGVPVVLGVTDVYWRPQEYLSRDVFHLGTAIAVTIGNEMRRAWVFGTIGSKQLLSECYSTREAAEAAKCGGEVE